MLPIQQYTLEGGVTVRDKTNGLARVEYSKTFSEKHKRPYYRVYINDKKIVDPNCSDPTRKIKMFINTSKIIIKLKSPYIKITKKDDKGKTVYYVDQRKCVKNIAYEACKKLTLESAKQKVQNLPSKFKLYYAVYNEHAVAVHGYESGKYVLYWANSYDNCIKKIDSETKTEFNEKKVTTETTANDRSVRLDCKCTLGANACVEQSSYFLNGEAATPFTLEK